MPPSLVPVIQSPPIPMFLASSAVDVEVDVVSFSTIIEIGGSSYGLARKHGFPEEWRISKSTDGGVSWTEIGTSAGLFTARPNLYFWQSDVVAPNIITFISGFDPGWPEYYDFDVLTASWTGPYASGGPNTFIRGFTRRSDGSLVLLYQAPFASFVFDVWDGSAWLSLATPVGNGSSLLLYEDPADRTHLIYGPNTHPHYNSISSSNILGTDHDFGFTTPQTIWNLWGTADGKLLMPITRSGPGPDEIDVKIWIGDSLGGTPTWTLEDVALNNFDPSVDGGTTDQSIDWVWAVDVGGVYTVFWLQSDYMTGDAGFFDNQIWYSQRVAGVWNGPFLYFDTNFVSVGPPWDNSIGTDMVEFSFNPSSTNPTGFGVMVFIDVAISGTLKGAPFYLQNSATTNRNYTSGGRPDINWAGAS